MIFGARTFSTAMVSTKDQKDEVILDRCAVIDAATAVFRFICGVGAGLLGSDFNAKEKRPQSREGFHVSVRPSSVEVSRTYAKVTVEFNILTMSYRRWVVTLLTLRTADTLSCIDWSVAASTEIKVDIR